MILKTSLLTQLGAISVFSYSCACRLCTAVGGAERRSVFVCLSRKLVGHLIDAQNRQNCAAARECDDSESLCGWAAAPE